MTDRPQHAHQDLDAFVAQTMERTGVPGVAVGLLHGEETITQGYGVTNVEHPLPVTSHTLFQVGSITKTFTCLALLRLVEAGQLDLDAPIRTYVPEFQVADADASAHATVRHLLTHTGGWPGDVFLDTGSGEDALARYVAAMADLEPLAPLGTVWSYNNAGFSLAGHVIERIRDQSYQQALRELVLEPLGLEHAYFGPGEVITHRFAVGHDVTDAGAQVVRPWALPRAVYPAGGLICDLHALLRYARFQIKQGRTEEGTQLLSAGTMSDMHSVQVRIGGARDAIGLAWMINHAGDTPYISHGGGTKGQITLLAIVPERHFAVIVLTNANQGGQVTRDVVRWTFKAYLGLEIPDPEPQDAPAEKLTPYAGRYARPYAEIELGMLAGKLVGQQIFKAGFPSQDVPPPPPPPPMTLALYEEDHLVVTDGPMKSTGAEIIRKPDGEIGWLRLSGRINPRQQA
jgi:CubicO group peptidase (beta-lactamase class C family)